MGDRILHTAFGEAHFAQTSETIAERLLVAQGLRNGKRLAVRCRRVIERCAHDELDPAKVHAGAPLDECITILPRRMMGGMVGIW